MYDNDTIKKLSDFTKLLIKLMFPVLIAYLVIDYIEYGTGGLFIVQLFGIFLTAAFYFSPLQASHQYRVYYMLFFSLYHLPTRYIGAGEFFSPILFWFIVMPFIGSFFLTRKWRWFYYGCITLEFYLSIIVIKLDGIFPIDFKPFAPWEIRLGVGFFIVTFITNFVIDFMDSIRRDSQRALIRTKQQNYQSERFAAMGQIVSTVSSEINNPLQIIEAQVYRLKSDLEESALESSVYHDTIASLRSSVQRLGKIVKAVSDLSVIDSKISIIQSVEESFLLAISVVERHFQNEQISLFYHKDDFRFEAKINKGLFTQVLINILENASHFLKGVDRKVVKIEVKENAHNYKVYIIDSGALIDRSVQEAMFKSFFTTREPGKGLGLGLSVARSNMQAMNGSIEYTIKEGHNCFELTLNKSNI